MLALEKSVRRVNPDLVLVYGDVTSSLAAALTCSKKGIPVAHIEAGMRSNDRTMPEEINRVLIDQIADPLFASGEDARKNLLREGIPPARIHVVGNVAIDTLISQLPQARMPAIDLPFPYILATLHRPSNVDDTSHLKSFIETLEDLSDRMTVVFVIHPRTKDRLTKLGHKEKSSKVRFTGPLGYLEFLALQKRAALVLTDSGGVQAETAFLGVPCVILREATETFTNNRAESKSLVGRDLAKMKRAVIKILAGDWEKLPVPKLWDGHAGERIAKIISKQI